MGKVKVDSMNGIVNISVKSAKGEQINYALANMLISRGVPGIIPFRITQSKNDFTFEYSVSQVVTLRQYFTNNFISQNAFATFLKSCVDILGSLENYQLNYSNVLIDMDTVLVDIATGRAWFLYYPVINYSNGKFFNTLLTEILAIMRIPVNSDASYLGRLNNMLFNPEAMSWGALGIYADSIFTGAAPAPAPVAPQPIPQAVPATPAAPVAPAPAALVAPEVAAETEFEKKVCEVCGAESEFADAMFCMKCGAKYAAEEGILIKNGRIVDPVTGKDEIADVLIKNNTIEKIGHNINANVTDIIDATGLVVAPGLVDTHVHFRDPGFTYKEDIETGAKAAMRGGFTTVVCMANTKPAVDEVETLNYIQEKGESTGIHILQTATVTKALKGEELVDMETLAKAGAAGFTDDGVPVMDEKLLVEAMNKAAELDLPISLHEEDPLFVKGAGVNQGEVSEKLSYGGASRTAEDVMVARDCMLALHTGASVCIQHISSGNSVELVRTAKKLGADIHAEATPHHFTLTEKDVLVYGTNARMNPPLRTEQDRRKIIEGIQDGTIDMIVTDHAPHSEEEKKRDLASAPSGITGLETSLGLGIKSLVEPGYISLMKLMEIMSKNPSEFYRMIPGSVSEGAVADLVIFGEHELWTVKKEEFASKSSNSPFINWQLPGKVHYTICSGKIVYSNVD